MRLGDKQPLHRFKQRCEVCSQPRARHRGSQLVHTSNPSDCFGVAPKLAYLIVLAILKGHHFLGEGIRASRVVISASRAFLLVLNQEGKNTERGLKYGGDQDARRQCCATSFNVLRLSIILPWSWSFSCTQREPFPGSKAPVWRCSSL